MKKLTTEQFIQKAQGIHGEKYDYSKTLYINNKTKAMINCPVHGDFEQIPMTHLKSGCRKCGIKIASSKRKINKDDIFEKIKEISNITLEAFLYNTIKTGKICPGNCIMSSFFQYRDWFKEEENK